MAPLCACPVLFTPSLAGSREREGRPAAREGRYPNEGSRPASVGNEDIAPPKKELLCDLCEEYPAHRFPGLRNFYFLALSRRGAETKKTY